MGQSYYEIDWGIFALSLGGAIFVHSILLLLKTFSYENYV